MSFAAVVTRDERVLVSWQGRPVVALAAADARRLIEKLEGADGEEAEQTALAKATGNFKRGNER